eukprot:SAG22_NODE_68_length_22846_cov_32.458258_15_plen_157_part_00
MRAAAAAFLLLASTAALVGALPTVSEIEDIAAVASGPDADALAKIAELEVAKQRAIATEDYDEAKRIKLDIEELKKPPPPPPPSDEEAAAEKQKLMIETVKKGEVSSLPCHETVPDRRVLILHVCPLTPHRHRGCARPQPRRGHARVLRSSRPHGR